MSFSTVQMDHIRANIQHARAASLEHAANVGEGDAKPADKAEAKHEGMSFWDVLDVVNPLQHIPIVNKIYQAVTGDVIRTPAKLAGAALFFGPVGLALAGADAVLEKETGKDALEHVASALGLEKDHAPTANPDEDGYINVTAPRPTHTAEAAIAAPAAPATKSGPVDLSTDQAALLEKLFNGGSPAIVPQAAPAVPATALTTKAQAFVPTSISANAPAAGGIGTAQQLKALEAVPGASAAVTAARGLGAPAIVASLPAPGGAGVGDNLVAAASQQQSPNLTQAQAQIQAQSQQQARPNGGKGLAEYRAAAISSGSLQLRPIVADRANQIARTASANQPNAAIPARAGASLPLPLPAAAPEPAKVPPQGSAAAPASDQPSPFPEGLTPLPRDQIADQIARSLDKYEALTRLNPATSTVH